MTNDTPSRPRRRLKPDDRKEELLAVAAGRILEHGADAVTMEGLAASAGVNKALLYHYFGSRDGVIAAVQARAFARLRDEVNTAIDQQADPLDRLRVVIRGWLDPSADATTIMLISAGADSDRLEAQRRQQGYETGVALADLLGEVAPAAGLGPLEAADAMAVAGTFLAGITGYMVAWRLNDWPLAEAEDRYLRLMLGAVRAATSA